MKLFFSYQPYIIILNPIEKILVYKGYWGGGDEQNYEWDEIYKIKVQSTSASHYYIQIAKYYLNIKKDDEYIDEEEAESLGLKSQIISLKVLAYPEMSSKELLELLSKEVQDVYYKENIPFAELLLSYFEYAKILELDVNENEEFSLADERRYKFLSGKNRKAYIPWRTIYYK